LFENVFFLLNPRKTTTTHTTKRNKQQKKEKKNKKKQRQQDMDNGRGQEMESMRSTD
jgi:hypothetical protein